MGEESKDPPLPPPLNKRVSFADDEDKQKQSEKDTTAAADANEVTNQAGHDDDVESTANDDEEARLTALATNNQGTTPQEDMPRDTTTIITTDQQIKRRTALSSVSLRKDVPTDFLAYDEVDVLSDDLQSTIVTSPSSTVKHSHSFAYQTCWSRLFVPLFLNEKYPLKKQMMLSFGAVAGLSIVLVVVVSVVSTIVTGEMIQRESSENVEAWVLGFMGSTTRLVVGAVGPKIMPLDLVNWMMEVGRDRFAGYPDASGDSQTPFFDVISQSNMYPLKNSPLPLDWDFRHTPNEMGNVNNETQVEHVQGRYPWYAGIPRLSTASAMYHTQGVCDPRASDPTSTVYFPNCTEENNNMTTGGVVPSPTNEQVYRKAADLSPFLKAFYEYHQDLWSIGYYFPNSGAGAAVMFPHYELDSTSTYVSVGCDWMRAPNPIDPSLGPIATEEEIARCHPEGAVVPTREYNPLERGWCRDQTLDPTRPHSFGPYLNAFDGKTWLVSVGQSFFDYQTGQFVSCFVFDFLLAGINAVLDEVRIGELGTLTLVRNDDDGTVVISPYFDYGTANETTTIDDPALQTGVDQALFNTIKSTVDFSKVWDPEEASNAFENVIETEEYLITAYPVPAIPETYDPNYMPEFYVTLTLSKTEGIAVINEELNDQVDERVRESILLVIIIGVVGLMVVMILILTTASWFVRPLKWISQVGEQVLGSFGNVSADDSGIGVHKRKKQICTPKTELNSLVAEFEKMVARFSGEGATTRMQINDTEKFNAFEFSQEFANLYKSRQGKEFAFTYPSSISEKDASKRENLEHCYLGRNTRDNDFLSESTVSERTKASTHNIYKSPFFHWLAGMIVTPVMITTTVISAVVLTMISTDLPSLTEPVEAEYMAIKDSFRKSATGLLASEASGVISKAARDTYMLTRFANWLFFEGMDLFDSFTDVVEGAEECKASNDYNTCEWVKNNAVCDCSWNDFFVRSENKECTEYAPGESRALQKGFFEAQSQDTNEDGSRYSTSYPEVAYFPNTTEWWDNIDALPTEASAATRYSSSYDRVRVLSALSTIFLPLYNYDTTDDKPLAAYVGFDADGMFAGYQGCEYGFVGFPFWISSEANGAASLRPELCPLGKYGFDPRCRGWYHSGKKNALLGNGTLHITAPYVFAGGVQITGLSTSQPIMQGDVHVGQTIIDFIPGAIFRTLAKEAEKLGNGAFPVMITPHNDAIGNDVVVGPGFSLDGDGAEVKNLLNPDVSFDRILKDMKAGNSGSGSFAFGRDNQIVYINYAPVSVKNVYPVNSSDIARGVTNETTLVYSLALVELHDGIMRSFQSIEDSTSKVLRISIAVLSVLIILSAALIVLIALRVAKYMTEPMLELLGVLKDINRMRASKDDIVKLKKHQGSCREVENVYKTIEMLYTVVQYANVAFFSGDLGLAYKVLQDAFRLFTRLENKKAIAVACNNLGNTCLTIYRTMKSSEEKELCGMTKDTVVEKGMAYFAQTIKLGEEAYDNFYNEQGWSEECLVFMQYLANRYFNRAIFLLTTSADQKEPKDAIALGFRDLQIVTDMDVEIVDQCTEMGFTINRSERFELMISRIRGLLALVELGFGPEELFIDDQVTDLFEELKMAMKNPAHELFKDIGIAGRMQKFDTELIKYFRDAKKDNASAAKVAIRMLIEDEYLFHDAQLEAIKMLLTFIEAAEPSESELCPPVTDVELVKTELTATRDDLEKYYDAKRSSYISTSLRSSTGGVARQASKLYSQESMMDDEQDDQARRRSTSAYRNSVQGDFTMETF